MFLPHQFHNRFSQIQISIVSAYMPVLPFISWRFLNVNSHSIESNVHPAFFGRILFLTVIFFIHIIITLFFAADEFIIDISLFNTCEWHMPPPPAQTNGRSSSIGLHRCCYNCSSQFSAILTDCQIMKILMELQKAFSTFSLLPHICALIPFDLAPRCCYCCC